MNRLLSVLAFILFGTHAYAQDVDFGAFGDAGSLLTPSAPARVPRRTRRAPARGAVPTFLPGPARAIARRARESGSANDKGTGSGVE